MKGKSLSVMSTARERLVDRVGSDFYDLHLQLTTGLQILLETHQAGSGIRLVVGEYMNDVLRGLASMEASVVKLAEMAVSHESIAGFGPTEHGHSSMAGLREELQKDTAARKGPDALSDFLLGDRKSEEPVVEAENDRDIER